MAHLLNRTNIRPSISDYLAKLQTLEVPTLPVDPISLFLTLKREKVTRGPYHDCSLFEVANRVMSDLVVLGAAESLLLDPPTDVLSKPIGEIKALLGIENGNDLSGRLDDGRTLVGECFNVSPSFFANKFRNSRRALEKISADVKLIAFNQEARSDARLLEKWKSNGFKILPLNISRCLERWREEYSTVRHYD